MKLYILVSPEDSGLFGSYVKKQAYKSLEEANAELSKLAAEHGTTPNSDGISLDLGFTEVIISEVEVG